MKDSLYDLAPIAPANPLAPYLGGKRNLAKRLCALIATIPHRTYVEPFVGMGGVFFRRDRRPPVEVINDISGDVANLFRVVRRHYEPLVEEFDWLLGSRAEFDRQRRVDPTTLTDIERAARFLYLQRLVFGGNPLSRFGVNRREPSRLRLANLRGQLRAVRDRLAPVTIEQLPYGDVIRRYDGPDVLFYLDPPYWGCERQYGPGIFERADFERLADQLDGIAGRFVLSINDTPGAREVFGRFAIEAVTTTYTIGAAAAGAGQRAGELIVSSGYHDPLPS